MAKDGAFLVLGLGNVLLSDDGVGVHVVRELDEDDAIDCRDGGTLGLTLLPEIETAQGLIVVDAARFGGAPGDVRVFEAGDFDARLAGWHDTVHELSLSDLMDAARLTGGLPAHRALVGVQPESTEWGMTTTPAVTAAVPLARQKVADLIERWRA